MNLKNCLLLEFVLIMLFVLVFNDIFNYDLFNKNIWEWTMIIGIGYLVIFPLNFVLFSLPHAMANVILGFSIIIASFFLDRIDNPYLSPVFDSEKIQEKEGKNYSSWRLLISYEDSNGYHKDISYDPVLGTYSNINIYCKKIETTWINNYPNTKFINIEKRLN